ncbi:MAG: molybdopterin-synthase adenylyltransferase MoeB [Gammaproteobacteria bacterium]|nr:molybdopterin-synthase adenylyltransferase MoeB [Gammaproteobacteria bacterium]MCK5263034.1 molybdopterin-synthase adenylyltransferase MoeB [Gammaproteobacteria bacterium]
MNDEQLLRYNRHIMLPQIGIEGQQKLCDAHVLIIGLGGLGSPAAMYLATAGVGQLALVDDDTVELSNLQRQIIHRSQNIGDSKVASAKSNLLAINHEIDIATIDHRLNEAALNQQIERADVVLDASDNFDTRFAINRACVAQKKPLVSGAAIQFDGQISVFDSRSKHCPCYSCLYPDKGEDNLTCSENGILAPVVGIIGSMQALEAIKLICHIGEPLYGRLLLFDALSLQWRTMNLKKDPNCPVCGSST